LSTATGTAKRTVTATAFRTALGWPSPSATATGMRSASGSASGWAAVEL
jgi:hypothetical protein